MAISRWAVLLPALFLQTALWADPGNLPAEQTDSIAASVNGEPISVRDLLEETARQEAIVYATRPKSEHYQAILDLRKKALDRAINRKLLLDAYKQQEFKIPRQYIESAMDEIAQSQAIRSRREFYAKLREQNTTPEALRKYILERIIIQAMTARRLQLKGEITPKEIREYFNAHENELSTPEEWELAMIAIPADSPVYKTAGGLKEMAANLKKAPSRFAAYATLYSTGPNAANGGSLGLIPRPALRPEFAEACKNAKPGETVGPFKADQMTYFLKIIRIKPGEKADFLKLEPELRKKLTEERSRQIMEEYYRELREKALIQVYQ